MIDARNIVARSVGDRCVALKRNWHRELVCHFDKNKTHRSAKIPNG